MSVDVKTIGYRFRVASGASVFDIVSTTELGLAKSNEIIRKFFGNFKILKSDRILKPGETTTTVDEGKVVSGVVSDVSKVEEGRVKPARRQREKMKIIWGNLRDLLDDEFTIPEYAKALKNAGYEYTKGSWEAVPGQQLRKLARLGKIEKIGERPAKFRKIQVPGSLRNDKEAEKNLKSLRAGEKVILETMK